MAILDIPCGLQGLWGFHGRDRNLPRRPTHHLCGRNRFTVNQAAVASPHAGGNPLMSGRDLVNRHLLKPGLWVRLQPGRVDCPTLIRFGQRRSNLRKPLALGSARVAAIFRPRHRSRCLASGRLQSASIAKAEPDGRKRPSILMLPHRASGCPESIAESSGTASSIRSQASADHRCAWRGNPPHCPRCQ